MNSLDWEAHQRLQRNQNHPQTVNTNCGPCPWMRNPGSSYTYPGEEAHSSRGSNMGLSGPAFSNQHRMEADSEDPDGEPLEEDDDPELTRKRKELSEIQDRILHKRVSIALKTVEKLETPHTNHMMTTRKRLSLRGRVNDLLRLRRSLSLSKPLTQRTQPSGLCSDVSPVEDHPLKLRVEALMRRRRDDLSSNSQIGDGPCAPPPPGPGVPTASQEDNVNQGFQRFLTLLNKGMDLDLLSRIVNDDSDELAPGDALLNSTLPAITSHGETGRCSGGAQQRDGSGGGSERTADPLSLDPSADNRKSPSHDEARTDDSGNCSLGSSRRSKSPPPPAAEKKRRKTEAEKPLLGDQHRQLQNILSTLGLSLGPEEMSKMTDRTQERLYGRREGRAAAERESPVSAVSPRRHRSSSSSSSSSSSTASKSPSQSLSPSPQNSHERVEKSKRSRSGDKSARTSRGGSRGAGRAEGPAQGHAEGHAKGHAWCEGPNVEENPFYQDQQFHPAAASSFYPGYGLDSHGAEHTAYANGTYGDARHPYWTSPQGNAPAHPYSQDDYRDAAAGEAHGWFDTDGPPHGYLDPLVNPDLSQSEGQRGSLYRTCCLLPVHGGEASVHKTTVKAPTNATSPAVPTLPNPNKKKKGKKKRLAREAWLARQREAWLVRERNKMMMKEHKLKNPIERQCIAVPLNVAATTSGTGAPGPAPSQAKAPLQRQEPTEKEERELTEEEIKANLRKKLEAFNQMARKKSQSQQNP